jgi:hypothetical protein
MNVQIYSNTPNQEGDVNYNNKFTITLPEQIDGENKTRYIRALNVTYPLAIDNIEEKCCGIKLKYNLCWRGILDRIEFETEMMHLPAGRYTLEKIINKLNQLVDEYGLHFYILNGGHVGVSLPTFYYFIYRIQDVEVVTFEHRLPLTVADFQFELSKNLQYILGMDEYILHPDVANVFETSGRRHSPLTDDILPIPPTEYILTKVFWTRLNNKPIDRMWFNFYGKYTPDITNGKTRMFIYCDEVVPSFVGNVRAPLLAQLKIETNYKTSVGVHTQNLPDITRELINSQIKSLHIRIHDLENNLIQFSGGSVSIECIIE